MLPFAFKDYDQAYKVLDGPFMDWAAPDLEEQGRVLFESEETQCFVCHPGPLYTDLQVHDVDPLRCSLRGGADGGAPVPPTVSRRLLRELMFLLRGWYCALSIIPSYLPNSWLKR